MYDNILTDFKQFDNSFYKKYYGFIIKKTQNVVLSMM